MLISLNWLKELVDISGYTTEELSEIITKTGIEVDGISEPEELPQGVVVGNIISCEQHPDADKLSLCQVDTGEETLQIACGAPNVKAGQKVAVAKPGAVLPGNFKIKKTKLRGEESNGMICSLQELGVNEEDVPEAFKDGIFVFPEDTETGEDAVKLLNLDDSVLELDVTPNRADVLSMVGMAYETAAALDRNYTLERPSYEEAKDKADSDVAVKIVDKEANPYYGAFVVQDVEVKESPLWLKNRLMAAGTRPVNNVVDITNYVLLEYGQPLHAFDRDRFNSDMIVTRYAEEGEILETLDGKMRTLSPHHLVITNGEKAHALAGVMGGKESEVHEGTTDLLLEAAYFDPQVVRQSANDHELRSESSVRFEKGLDVNRVAQAGERACELLQKYAGATILKGIAEEDHLSRKETVIRMETSRLNDRLGTKMEVQDVKNVLRRLQFEYEEKKGVFDVQIPSRRFDISIFEDMLEETARIYGYDHIPYTLPEDSGQAGGLTEEQRLKRNVKTFLEGAGLSETITYSLTDEKSAEEMISPELKDEQHGAIRLAMPMSEDHSHLRLSILPELLRTHSYNTARQQQNLAYYELGKVFISREDEHVQQPKEVLRAAGAVSGEWVANPWQQEKKEADFFVVKGIVEEMAGRLGLSFTYVKGEVQGMHPGRTALVICNGKTIGFMGQVHPRYQKTHDLKETYVFDLNMDLLLNLYEREETFVKIPKFPSVSRDIALVVDEKTSAGEIEETILTTGAPLIKQVRVFDVYQGEHLDPGEKSIAFRLLYQNPERTLKDKEVEEAHGAILEAVAEKHDARLRQ
ncbi:phenylalanine--tRNA ligase subunit beta [Salimicrobium humidisoli]|uniref:Phenylalanine--tRNA ligase beta subunit n=1 Tax=Salimicrobium humidisoli TaxID=2029857 RepID=A0ABX4HU21_9BACI|nr:phenylalanine--tRNA ligase subunit beta [Salimicrobium humidisoli]PBB06736.1 phenylalanine--tRNA ligase subunit beta [Salimicrobium humidisoli]